MRSCLLTSAFMVTVIIILLVVGFMGTGFTTSHHNTYTESKVSASNEKVSSNGTVGPVVPAPVRVCSDEIFLAENLSVPNILVARAYKAFLLSDDEAISTALRAYQILRGLDKPPAYSIARKSSSSIRLILQDGGEIRVERDIAVISVDYGDPLSLRPANASKVLSMRDKLVTLVREELVKTLGAEDVVLEPASPVTLYRAVTDKSGGENISNLRDIALSFKIRLQVGGEPIYGVLGRIMLVTNGESFHLVIPDIKLEPLNQTVTLSFTRALENLKKGAYLVNMGTFHPCNATIIKYWTGYYLTPGHLGGMMPPAIIFGVQNSDGYWTVPVRAG